MKHSGAWYGVSHLSVCQLTNAGFPLLWTIAHLYPDFIHSFNRVTEHSLCARHYSRFGGEGRLGAGIQACTRVPALLS